MFLGGENFVEKLAPFLEDQKSLSEIPSSQRRGKPKRIKDYEKESSTRNEAIKSAYLSGGYTLKEVGDYFGLHYTTVSGIVKSHKSKT